MDNEVRVSAMEASVRLVSERISVSVQQGLELFPALATRIWSAITREIGGSGLGLPAVDDARITSLVGATA